VEAKATGLVVSGNTISNVTSTTPDVIAVWFENEDSTFSTGTVNENNLDVTIAHFGIAVDPSLSSGPVDGTCNWWGSANGPGPIGPGSGAQVSTKVTSSPWLLSPAPFGACGGGLSAKDCHEAVEQSEKDFNDQQKADKKAFDDQQKAADKANDASNQTKQQKKAFDDQQKADKKAFDDKQKADKDAFQEQYKAEEKACKQQ